MTKSFVAQLHADGFSEQRPDRFRTSLHDHGRGELIWSTSVQEVRTPERVWITPPEGAIWVPPGQLHRSVTPWAGLEHELYLDAPLCEGLPVECCIVWLDPELRSAAEAISAGASASPGDALLETLRARIRPAAVPSLPNPVPEASSALRPILEAVERDPADARSLADWARFMRISVASLRRRFHADLGCGFRAWRQRMALLAAVERLARGEPSASVAAELDYRSASSFTAAFRRELAVTPSALFAALRQPVAAPAFTPSFGEASGDAAVASPGITADRTHIEDVCYFPRHCHGTAELLWSPSSVQSVATDAGVWVVPPGRAAWIPAGVQHDVRLRGSGALYYALIDIGVPAPLPDRCCVVEAPAAVQRAIQALAAHGRRVEASDIDARALIEGLREARTATLSMPLEPLGKLEPVLAALRDHPASEHRLEDWASLLSMSPRTFARAFQRDVGTSFGDWRRLTRLRFALEQLALGNDVTHTAELAGFRSVSMFVAMFRRALGTTPGRYGQSARAQSWPLARAVGL